MNADLRGRTAESNGPGREGSDSSGDDPRVAAALESSRIDPPFKNALPHLLWLLDGA